MKKKDIVKSRTWEKDRRDRLNKTFDELAKLLPEFKPNIVFSKIEILQKTIAFVEELQDKTQEVLQAKCPSIMKSVEELEESLKALIVRNNELLALLSKAGIKVPPFTGPKLLRCVVAVQRKELSASVEKHEVSNQCSVTKCITQRPATKDELKMAKNGKKINKSVAVQKKVINRTFGQRKNAERLKQSKSNHSNRGSINDIVDKTLLHISENSSLEKISVLEQNVIPANTIGEERDDRISVLLLFAQHEGKENEPSESQLAEPLPRAGSDAATSISIPSRQSTSASVPNNTSNCSAPFQNDFKKSIENVKVLNCQSDDKPSNKASRYEKNTDNKKKSDQTISNVSRKRVKTEINQDAKLSDIYSIPGQQSEESNLAAIVDSTSDSMQNSITADITNELLDNLQISADDHPRGSEAFLLSFSVAPSAANRPNDTERAQQLSPTETGLIDMDAGHNMTTRDQQLLDNISSLFTQTTPKPIGTSKRGTPFAIQKREELVNKTGIDTVPSVTPEFPNTKPNDDLSNLNVSSIQTELDKPRELYESHTFAEILESLKASPSKAYGNIENDTSAYSKHIPDFSFSSNSRANNHFGSNVISSLPKPTSTTSFEPATGGFYEALSSIKPIVSPTVRGTNESPTKSAAVVTAAYNASSAYSVSKLTNKQEYTNSFILPKLPFSSTQTCPPSIVPSYSSMNVINSYSYDAPIAANDTTASVVSVPDAAIYGSSSGNFSHISTTPHSKLCSSSATNHNQGAVKEASFPSFSFGSNVPKASEASAANNQPQRQSQLCLSKSNHFAEQQSASGINTNDMSKPQKKHINWMMNDIVPYTNINNSALNSFSTPVRNQPQTPQSAIENSVPWSTSRFSDAHGFRIVPALPTLHGDLFDGDQGCNTSKYTAQNKKFQVQSNELRHSKTERNTSQSIAGHPNHSTPPTNQPFATSSGSAHFFSVTQLVDEAKDHRNSKFAANKPKVVSHTTRKETTPPCSTNANINMQPPFSATVYNQAITNKPHSTVQTTATPFSIPNLMAEPVAATSSQQLSSSYSAEALIFGHSSSAANTNAPRKKQPSSSIASHSLSLEFYNPADSLMDFSTSNEIFNPYVLASSYTHQPSAVDNAQLNSDLSAVLSTPAQNYTIANITQNYPAVTAPALVSNSQAIQFPILSSESKTCGKQKYNYSQRSPLAPSSSSTLMVSQMEALTATSSMDASFKPSLHQHPNYPSSGNNGIQYCYRSPATNTAESCQKPLVHLPNEHFPTANARDTTIRCANSMQISSHPNYLGSNNSNVLNFNLSTICPEIGNKAK